MNYLVLLFVLTPIIEMWILIKVGGIIGALPTIGLVLLTAVIGLALLKQQGFATLLRARQKMAEGQVPAKEMVEGIFLAAGGVLLLTPGFVTDTLGFFCLLPGLRHLLIVWGIRHFKPQVNAFRQQDFSTRDQSQTIEGEFRREDKNR